MRYDLVWYICAFNRLAPKLFTLFGGQNFTASKRITLFIGLPTPGRIEDQQAMDKVSTIAIAIGKAVCWIAIAEAIFTFVTTIAIIS